MKSKSQVRYLFATKPKLAKEFAEKTLSIKNLPEKVKKKGKKNYDEFGYYKRNRGK